MTAVGLKISVVRQSITRVVIEANPDFDPASFKGAAAELGSVLNMGMVANKVDVAMATQHITSPGGGDLPYSIDVEAIGYFRLINNDDPDLVTARAVAHEVLYSSVRELILSNTCRMAWGAFQIGPATFDEGAQKKPDGAEAVGASGWTSAKAQAILHPARIRRG